MSEEKAVYATVTERVRATLGLARDVIASRQGNQITGAIVVDKMDISMCEHFFNSLKTIDDAIILSQIDDALTMKSPEPDLYSPMQVQRMIRDAYDEGKECWQNNVTEYLLDLPGKIKSQSSTVADLTADIEKLRLIIATSKNQSWELVLCATVTDMGKTKEKYTNEKARNMAVEQIMRDNQLYIATVDELSRKECELRKEQIQLEYLHNQFRAYIAIAGMRGVR